MTRPLSLHPTTAERLRYGDERIVVTGATGWLGQALIEMLSTALGPAAFELRVRCFGSASKPLRLRTGFATTQHALADIERLPPHPSILFHFAYLTKEKTVDMSLFDYVQRNRSISALVERTAAKIGANRVLLMSSGAASQAAAAGATLESTNAYGALKLEDEARFEQFANGGARRRVLAVRLFNLSGPYINKLGSYALSSFIEQARLQAAIDIKARHRVIRSYTGVENLLATSLAHLLEEQADPWICMDTAGEREVEVEQLAERVLALVNPQAVIRRPDLLQNGEDRYVGNPARYRAMAAQHDIALHALDTQIHDTHRYLAQITS